MAHDLRRQDNPSQTFGDHGNANHPAQTKTTLQNKQRGSFAL
jgi:hypothetical protein